MTVRPCWTCRQPATHTLTREGSLTLNACDNCTRIDRAEAEGRGWTVTPLPSTTRREETPLNATADDSYATCPRCKWAGKLRKDGTVRKHRESVDMGRFTMAGGLPQQRHGDICKGSGEKPWEPGLPEGYEVPKQNQHGGFQRDEADREQARQEAKQDSGPSLDDYAKASRIIQSLIPGVRR